MNAAKLGIRCVTRNLSTMVSVFFVAVGFGCNQVQISDVDITEVTEAEVTSAMTETGTVLLDVRKADKFAEGHMPGAVNIFLPEIRQSDPRLMHSKTIIVYGSGWTDPLAPAGAKRLLALKYSRVHLFRGGMEVWRGAGHQIERSPVEPTAPTEPEASKEPSPATGDQAPSGDQGTSPTPAN